MNHLGPRIRDHCESQHSNMTAERGVFHPMLISFVESADRLENVTSDEHGRRGGPGNARGS
jgi:hypothetical protein